MDLRNLVYRAISGEKNADVSGKGTDILAQLRAIGGSSSRTKSGIDLTQAAAKLGVQRRTVERWVAAAQGRTGQAPSAASAKKLAKVSRQAASTKAGRQAAISHLRPAANRPVRLNITGMQGPQRNDIDYFRYRTTTLVLDPAEAQALMDAYEKGGEQGFMNWAKTHWDDNYLPDWQFGALDDVEINQQYGGRWI